MSNNRLNHFMTCTVHKELVKELSLKQVTNDFMDNGEALIHIWPLFYIATIDMDECHCSLNNPVLVISDQYCYIISVELTLY